MIQALVFDFDGLILDTEWPEFQAWQELCLEYQVELDLETWLPCVGTGATTQVFDPHTYLEPVCFRWYRNSDRMIKPEKRVKRKKTSKAQATCASPSISNSARMRAIIAILMKVSLQVGRPS